MPNALLRTTLILLIALLSGCVTDRVVTGGDQPPRVSSSVHTIVLARGQKAVIADESLTVELVEINDSRCPVKVTCIWAGHAAVTLQVGKPGLVAGRVVIGSEAPSSMNLPADANYGGYLFHLVELERGNAEGSTQVAPSQSATIKVSRLPNQ
ncbi:hypothetical protein CSC74_12045 [Pseudoxanthomonas yeongjuensis]|uniref:hypothetical protein n=1 Tax=Pseudoxanthomonas yeongjuensis TaxID=377616 RepID=UPI001391F34F|nr:hypothetical protein [Pseudoxanthomonas yeongjuensis]KAF1715896.1 hypothetical protein CSC74_12045 [Pseudoxanthomonas yeongjuensis]